MTNFNYNPGVPAGPNNPSVDQPDMLTNTISIQDILAIDHVTFRADNGGTHKQITFSSENTPAAPTDPISVSFTAQASTLATANPVGSGSNIAQAFYRSQNGIFPESCIKAFASFTATNPPTLLTSFNVASIAFNTPTFDLTFVTNSTKGNNAVVLTSCNGTASLPYTFVEGLLKVQVFAGTATIVNICIIQI